MKIFSSSLAFAMMLPIASFAQGAVVNLPTLTPAGPEEIAESCISWVQDNHPDRHVAVAIVDASGSLLYFERMQGASAQVGAYALGKADTARQNGSLSGADMDRLTKENPDLQVLTFGRLALQGGVAIRNPSDNVLMGAIGVSGLSSVDDELCGQSAIAAVLR